MRRLTTACALLLAVSACTSDATTTTEAPDTTPAPPTSGAPTTTTTTTLATTTTDAVPMWPLRGDDTLDVDLEFDFTVIPEDEPALDLGDGWDGTFTYSPYVVIHDGTFYMFYTGWAVDVAVGLATSTDGLTFTRVADEPVLEWKRTENGRTAFPHRPLVRVADDGTWVMYVSTNVSKRFNGTTIHRATAPAPEGPWELDPEPVFEGAAPWASEVVGQDLVDYGGEIVLLFDGISGDSATGAIRSTDGVSFTAFDDPTTDDAVDPVLTPQMTQAWDGLSVGSPLAFAADDGSLELFYLGFEGPENLSGNRTVRIGYARGDLEGAWQRFVDNPVIVLDGQTGVPGSLGYPWMSGVRVDDTYYLYYAIDAGGRGIGVITGTIVEQ